MARISTYDKDVSLSGKDKVVGSNYVSTINQVDQYVTNNFTLKDLAEYFTGQIIIDPVNLSLKSNGGLVYETVNDTNFLAVDLSATNITGQLANSDLVNSYITINGTNVQLGGSISIPIGDITSVIAGTYLNGGGTIDDVTLNHDLTSRTDTTSAVGPNYGANFTVVDTLTSNATGHITAANVKTVTLPNGPNDNTITLSAGTYLSGGGDFTVDQSFNETLTINHDSTSRSDTTSNDSNNAASDTFTAIDSVSTNATGHVTAVNLKTIQFPSDANTDVDVNVSNLETRLGQIGNTSIGSSGSTITIPNLTVTGTQTINNVEVISTSSGIVFEGTSNDANETTLNVINPTADRVINLPNKSGTVALTNDIETYDLSVSSSGTAASIDLDLVNSGGTDIVVITGGGGVDVTLNSAQQFTISHTDTSSQASVNNSGNTFIQDITLDTYGHITGITSATATDNDTITQIREDNSSYRTGNITLQSGTNVTITEPSTGVFNFAATDTNTNNYVTGASVSGTTTKTLTLTRQGLSNITASWTDIDTNTNDIDYINSASFNTGNGILTLSGVGNAGATVDLDGRYLTSYTETDTLDTVTGRNNSTSNDIFVGAIRVVKSSDPYIQFYESTSIRGDVFVDTSENNMVLRGALGHGLRLIANGNSESGSSGISLNTSGDVAIAGTYDSNAQLTVNTTQQYGISVKQNKANATEDFSDVLFLQNTNQGNANRCKIGFSTNGTDGQHHRASIGAVRNTDANYNGNIIFEHRQSDGTHLDRFLFKYNGDFEAFNDVIAFNTSVSDKRLKNDIVTIDNALHKIENLRGVRYVWNNGSKKGKKDLGVIAQEVEKILPEIVTEKEMKFFGEKKYKTVDYEKLTAVLIEAVKELSNKVKALENDITK